MKTLMFAAAMAAVLIMPAVAEDVKKPLDKAERHEVRKDMRDKFRGERKEMKAEHKAAFEAVHKECKERRKAADTPEVMDAIKKDCRAKHDALREKFGLEKEKHIKDRRDKRDEAVKERREHRKELKGERDEKRAKHKELRGKEGASKE